MRQAQDSTIARPGWSRGTWRSLLGIADWHVILHAPAWGSRWRSIRFSCGAVRCWRSSRLHGSIARGSVIARGIDVATPESDEVRVVTNVRSKGDVRVEDIRVRGEGVPEADDHDE